MNSAKKIYIGLLAAIIALLSGIFVLLMILLFAPQPEEKEIIDISLDTRNVKSEFYIGEPFAPQGLGIEVTYVDGTEELVLPSDGRCNVLAPDMSKVGTEEVLVKFGNFTKSYQIKVSRIDGLRLDLSDVNLFYEQKTAADEGEQEGFSANGVRVFLLISEAQEGYTELKPVEKELDISEYTVSEPDLTTVGSKTVTVEYAAPYIKCQAAFDICVLPSVDSMSSLGFNSTDGNDLTMYITSRSGGGNASSDGTADGWCVLRRADGTCGMYFITALYSSADGSVTIKGDSAVQANISLSDANLLEVTVDGCTFSVALSGFNFVAFGWPRAQLGYELDYSEAKREYVVGGTFTSENLRVVMRYSDNTAQEADGQLTVLTSPDMDEIGVKTIEVRFTDTSGGNYDFSYQIYCIPDVNWDTNRLEFGYDRNGSGASLELFVTSRSNANGGWGQEQYTEGWLLLRNADGTFEMYEYIFYLDADVRSHPYPNGNPEGIWSEVPNSGMQYSDNLVIYINGRTFVASDNNLWHLIVIGWQ